MSACLRILPDGRENGSLHRIAPESSIVIRHSSISGFTLLELLASISILGIIVVMMAQIFSESDRAWNSGTGRSVNNTEGRAALNMLMRDLQTAVSDDILTFQIAPNRAPPKEGGVTYGFTNSEISFVSLQNDSADTNRTAREIQYWVNTNALGNYQLVRSEVSDAILSDATNHCYYKPDWYDNPHPSGTAYAIMAENVVGLRFYDNNGNTTYESGAKNANRYTPPYVDVYLEIMNEREAKQLYDLKKRFGEGNSNCTGFVEMNARRYTGRVFFQNRQGYKWR